MRILRRLLSKLIYGGSFAPRDYERSIIACLRSSLAIPDQAALDRQMSELRIVQRFNSDRMVMFRYLSPLTLPKLINDRPDQELGWVAVATEAVKLRVRAVSHRGLFFSLEFSRPPKVLSGKHVNLTLSSRRKDDRNLDAAIDAEEHAETQEEESD